MGRYLDIAKAALRDEDPEKADAVRQSLDTSETELQASRARLESQRISIAIKEDGTARVIHTDGRLNDGETRYQPHEMELYVTLSPAERRLLHSFKRTFGANTEVKP